MELVINSEVGLADVINGIEEERQEDKDLSSGELEHRSEDNDEVCADLDHSPQCAIHVLKDVNVSVENLQDLSNWSHIKEKINWGVQDFLESMTTNLFANLMVATINNVVLDHVK